MSNSIIRVPKGNDWHIQLLVSEEGSDQHIDLHEVSDLKVELIHQHCGRTVTPPYSIGVSGVLQLELEAHQQELGLYDARVSFSRPNSKYSDGLEHRTISVRDAIKVVHAHEAGDKGVTITGYLAALSKGDKGDPGDPTELLDELSRQQSDRLNEIATAQRESLKSIGARLSDEQRTTLEGLAGRLSREQSAQIAQQTERLSTEQASGLQVISDRLSSEQSAQLERQGQERAGAQAEALKAIPAKVTDEVARLMPDAVSGRIGGEVQAQLSDVVAQQIPEQVEEQLPAQVDSRLPDLVDGRLPEAVDGKLPAVIDAKLPALVDERMAGAVETAMPSHLGTALPPVVASALPSEVERQLPPLVRPAVQELVTGDMVAEVVTQAGKLIGKVGGRNLVLRSDKIPPNTFPSYNIARLKISKPWVAGGKYILSACISIKSDNPSPKYYVYPNQGSWSTTGLTVGEHVVSEDGWVTSIYRGTILNIHPSAVVEDYLYDMGLYCYTYNGRKNFLAKIHWIKLEEGTVATEWTPAPEDAYANLCEERLATISQARSQLWAQYGKIVPNSALSSETQSAVQRLWTNYDGAYNRLRKALQDVVNQPSEQAYTALSSLSDQYQTAASDLQAGMTEAMLSLSPAGQIDYDTLAQSITGSIALDSESRLTIKGQPIGESLKGADGRDGRDGAEVRLDQGWIRPLVVNMRHSPLRGRSNTIPSMDEMQAGVLANPDYLPELWSNSETLYASFYTNRNRAQHFWWGGLRAYNDGTSGRRVIMRVEVSGLQGQHIRLVWTEAQMAKIYELIFNASGTRSIYVDITDIDDRLHFLTTPGSGGVGGVSMVAIYESLASDNPQLPRGTWAQRPKTPYIGQQYIATDMRHNGVGDLPMWYNGVMWIDYEGHDVTRRYLIE